MLYYSLPQHVANVVKKEKREGRVGGKKCGLELGEVIATLRYTACCEWRPVSPAWNFTYRT